MSDEKDTILFDDEFFSEQEMETIQDLSPNETIGLSMLDDLFDEEEQKETYIEALRCL